MKNKSWIVTVLRVLVGWHFLYEGLWRLTLPGGWSAAGCLRSSQWFAAPLFQHIAETPDLLHFCDFFNMWGLTAIGAALLFGVLIKPAAAFGVILLALHYIVQPPFLEFSPEGHYLLIDRNVIEAIALLVVVAIPSYGIGEYLIGLIQQAAARKFFDEESSPVVSPGRRELLMSLSSLPAAAIFGYAFLHKHGPVWERDNLVDNADVATADALKSFSSVDIRDLSKPLDQHGRIGDLKLSRMVLGGDLIRGCTHARDLLYVDQLAEAYHDDQRIFKTLKLAEQCGLNTILANPALMRVINAYWKREGGKIQFISDCEHREGVVRGAQLSVENGASAIYVHGHTADTWARKGDHKSFQDAVVEMRKLGVPVGVGAYKLETVQFCVEHDIVPDFWVKTLHHTDYRSDPPEEGSVGKDNIRCVNPEATIAYMENLTQPWIAFKTLAAGAIPPQDGFNYAFKNGADFICADMFDFQVVENINIVNSILDNLTERKRPWRG